jgi:hypothetical protein
MVRRQIVVQEDIEMVRWITVQTGAGKLRALVFWAGPKQGHGISLKLQLETVARVLARACGHAGSCADYLYNTVSHLEALGIKDRNLWRLQQLVALEIVRTYKLPEAGFRLLCCRKARLPAAFSGYRTTNRVTLKSVSGGAVNAMPSAARENTANYSRSGNCIRLAKESAENCR